MESVAGQQSRDNRAFIAIDNRYCIWPGMDGETIDVPVQTLGLAFMSCKSCWKSAWTVSASGIGKPARADGIR